MLRRIVVGVRRLISRETVDRELDDEVHQYIDLAIEEHLKAGLSRGEAERAARIAFGGVENVKEQLRSAGWDSALSTIWQDVRFAVRMLGRSRAFTAVTLATIVVGIGANTAMFSVVRAVMLRPLPYAHPEQLVMLWSESEARGLHEGPTAYQTAVDWRTSSRSFVDLATFSATTAAVMDEPRERLTGVYASANLFPLLGVGPALGRVFTPREQDDRVTSVVLSHALWQRRFGGDSSVVGKTLRLDDSDKGGLPSLTVVGVMPESFAFPDRQTQFWVPATLYWRWERERTERFPSWARRWSVVGRLASGVSPAAARRELEAVGTRLNAEYPTTVPDFPGFVPRVVGLLDQVTGPQLQSTLWLLLGAVGLVLLIACANVAHLLLARGATRQHELATRRALGASRARLVRQMMVESLVLAVIGGVLGVGVAVVVTRTLGTIVATEIPRFDELRVDAGVVLFAVLASLATGIAFGTIPALSVTRVSPGAALKEGGRSGNSARRRNTSGLLVVAECSLAVVLLVGAGLLLRSLAQLHGVDAGFKTERVLSLRVAFPRERSISAAEARTTPNADQVVASEREAALTAMLDRLATTTGVERAAFADDILIRGDADESITFPGRTDAPVGQLYTSSVSPELFETLDIPLRSGRRLTRADAATKIRALWGSLSNPRLSLDQQSRVALAEPVVVNEAFVRRFFPGQDPVGKRFCVDPNSNKTYWYEIVGVVGDMHRQSLERQPIPEYFQTLLPRASAELLVRTRADPLSLTPSVRRLVAEALPGSIVLDVTTLDRRMGDLSAQRRFQTSLLTAFALLAVLLAAIGVYGIVHYAVAERWRELGVRAALGAAPGDLFRDVVRRGMTFPVIGLTVGLAVAAGTSRLLTNLLFGIGRSDPVTIATAVGMLSAAAMVACYLPARRAARVDPIIALRSE